MIWKAREATVFGALVLLFVAYSPYATLAQDGTDWVTGFQRDPVHVAAWPAGKKVAVSFALFVEEFGFGQGPVFRPDLATRSPDLVNEAFRQYAIDWGITRVGRLFKELNVPLTIVLNSEFPGAHSAVWKEFRAIQPDAPIVAHGMNNTSHTLPLGRGLAEQKAYIRGTLDQISAATGVRPTCWSSPSVYSNGDTMQALAAEGIVSTLDQMDSDIISRLETPDGPLVLLPYPNRHGRHGSVSGADENAVRDRGALGGLRVGARYRGTCGSRSRGDDSRDWNPPICRRHARWGSGHAARARAPQER